MLGSRYGHIRFEHRESVVRYPSITLRLHLSFPVSVIKDYCRWNTPIYIKRNISRFFYFKGWQHSILHDSWRFDQYIVGEEVLCYAIPVSHSMLDSHLSASLLGHGNFSDNVLFLFELHNPKGHTLGRIDCGNKGLEMVKEIHNVLTSNSYKAEIIS